MSQEERFRKFKGEFHPDVYTITVLFEKDSRTYIKASNIFGDYEFDTLTSTVRKQQLAVGVKLIIKDQKIE